MNRGPLWAFRFNGTETWDIISPGDAQPGRMLKTKDTSNALIF